MRFLRGGLRFCLCLCAAITRVSTAITSTTEAPGGESKDEYEENEELGVIPLTDEVMDPGIKITDVPDVDEETAGSGLDRNRVVRDVAYFIRAHKFRDYDRRYYKSASEAPARLYEEFPKPPLRSLHWEVRKHCDASFLECLKYLERIIKLTALRREDDTVTVMREQKWSMTNNTEQILAAQRDCQMAQRRDDLTAAPFQGPIERFQWRTTVSYYMCWYTMLGVPELAVFGESCDNHANCLDEYGAHNRDPRADDTKPYACALYSFCPDHCCPMEHIWYMKDCFQSRSNPCHSGNRPAHRKCTLVREENRDFAALRANRMNVSCECSEPGHEWSSKFGMCIDVNECTRGSHNCSIEHGETCINLPGSFDCICQLGYVYGTEMRRCVASGTVGKALRKATTRRNATEVKSVLALIVQAIAGSAGNDSAFNASFLMAIVILPCVFTRR